MHFREVMPDGGEAAAAAVDVAAATIDAAAFGSFSLDEKQVFIICLTHMISHNTVHLHVVFVRIYLLCIPSILMYPLYY
jgi:hypothetical protein